MKWVARSCRTPEPGRRHPQTWRNRPPVGGDNGGLMTWPERRRHTTKARLDVVLASTLINSLCGRPVVGQPAAVSAEIIRVQRLARLRWGLQDGPSPSRSAHFQLGSRPSQCAAPGSTKAAPAPSCRGKYSTCGNKPARHVSLGLFLGMSRKRAPFRCLHTFLNWKCSCRIPCTVWVSIRFPGSG